MQELFLAFGPYLWLIVEREIMQTTTPPGQTFAKRWALYAAFGAPTLDLKTWQLSTKGLIERPLTMSFTELEQLPQVKLTRDFHCVGPGNIIFANPEPKPIEEIRKGDHIIGLNGRRHIVRQIFRREHRGELLKIKASYLPEVSLTPDHQIWAVRGHRGEGITRSRRRLRTFESNPKPSWIEARDLRSGDYVFFPKYRQIAKKSIITGMGQRFELSNAFAYVLGWYVADGSGGDTEGRVVTFALHRNQLTEVARLSRALKQVFGARISVYKERNMNLVKVTSSETKQLGLLFKSWCGNDAGSKRIPDFILNANAVILRRFLVALIEGDGYCPWRLKSKTSPKSRYDFLDITTLSTKLAYQLILALSKLGVAGDLVDHPGSVRNAYSVRVHGFDQISRIMPVKNDLHVTDRRHFRASPNGFYYPIQRIESIPYNGTVYDFTADGFTMLSPFASLDCVTTWSIKDVVWEGVSFRELAKLTSVKKEAKWVMFHCADGYTAPVPLEDAMVEDSLIALKMNGKPIPVEQGFPARPFIPHLYGWKSAKWLTAIEFLPQYEDGYWETYGYHERGNVWDQERFKGQGGKHVRHKGLGSVPV